MTKRISLWLSDVGIILFFSGVKRLASGHPELLAKPVVESLMLALGNRVDQKGVPVCDDLRRVALPKLFNNQQAIQN